MATAPWATKAGPSNCTNVCVIVRRQVVIQRDGCTTHQRAYDQVPDKVAECDGIDLCSLMVEAVRPVSGERVVALHASLLVDLVPHARRHGRDDACMGEGDKVNVPRDLCRMPQVGKGLRKEARRDLGREVLQREPEGQRSQDGGKVRGQVLESVLGAERLRPLDEGCRHRGRRRRRRRPRHPAVPVWWIDWDEGKIAAITLRAPPLWAHNK